MPSFPSYYLSDLDRKRERSRKLREGLQSGMAGAFEGVDRLAQLQMALQGKATAGAEAKAKAEKEAEALAHGRDIEAANQAREDAEPAAGVATGEGASGILARMQSYLEGGEERGQVDPNAPIFDEEAAAKAAAVGEPTTTTNDILSQLDTRLAMPRETPEAGSVMAPSNADRIEEARLEKMQAEAAIAKRKAAAPVAPPRPSGAPKVAAPPKVEDQIKAERLRKVKADADLAERKTKEMQNDPALAHAPPTILQFWGNVKGTAEQMRGLGKQVKPDDFSLTAKAQADLPILMQSDRVRQVTSLIDRVVQRAGVGMEGGKLAEGDIARYRKMLMGAMDSHEGFVRATQEIAAELDQKVADEQAMFRGGAPAAPPNAPAADPQAAFMQMVLDLRKQLGRKPTKEEIQAAAQAAGVVIE